MDTSNFRPESPKFDADNFNVTAFFKACHTCSVDHGWWDDKYSDADDPKMWFGEKLALTIGECVEASAEEHKLYFTGNGKPEGCIIECADIIIRLADVCGRAGVLDHAAYDVNRSYMYAHPWAPGQLKLFRNLQHDYPFMSFIVPINSCLESFRRTPDWKLVALDTLYFLYTESFYKFAEPDNESAFHKALIVKYEYNLSRPYRHGGLRA